jgi:hypothetical protein
MLFWVDGIRHDRGIIAGTVLALIFVQALHVA